MKASCLCGRVTFNINAPFISVSYCHCGNCRKSHGAAAVAYGACLKSDIDWGDSKKAIRRYASSERVRRGFCKDCGSNIYYYNKDHPNHLDIAIAIIDEPVSLSPERHLFVECKANWYSINDDLPQFPSGA